MTPSLMVIASEVRGRSLKFTDTPQCAEVKAWDVTGVEITIGIMPVE